MPKRNSVEVVKINEYKLHNGIEYFYVLWSDDTESWVESKNISEKKAVMHFINNIMNILHKKRQESEEHKRSESLSALREQLLSKNPIKPVSSTNLGIASGSMSRTITVDNTLNKKVQSSGFHTDLPSPYERATPDTGFEISEQSMSKHFTPSHSLTSSHGVSRQHLKSQKQSIYTTSQDFKIVDGVERLFSVKITSTVDYGKLMFDIKDGVFVSNSRILPVLLNLYFVKRACTSYIIETAEDYERNDLTAYMVKNKTACFFIQKNQAWILLFNEANRFHQANNLPGNDLLIRVSDVEIIGTWFSTFSSISNYENWSANTYKGSMSYKIDGFFNDPSNYIPQSKSICFIGDVKSYKGKCIKSYLEKMSSCVKALSKNTDVVIQREFVEYIHQINDFSHILRSSSKFFIEKSYTFEEIFKYGGVVFLSTNYIEYSQLDNLRKIQSIVKAKNNWKIIIHELAYKAFKARLTNLNLSKSESLKYKELYFALKSGTVPNGYSEVTFFECYKRRNIKNHRFFIQIDLDDAVMNNSMSFEEAVSFMSKI